MSTSGGDQSAPAGWYTVEGQQRYWDGTKWTDHAAPAAGSAPGAAEAATQVGGAAQQGMQQSYDPTQGVGQPAQQFAQQAPGGFGLPQQGGLAPQSVGPGGLPVPQSSDDTTMAMIAHIGGIFFSFLAPLIIWLIKKDESAFVKDQSVEALNFQITIAIGMFVSGILSIILIGLLGLILLPLIALVLGIMGGLAANKGEAYRYPFAWRLIK